MSTGIPREAARQAGSIPFSITVEQIEDLKGTLRATMRNLYKSTSMTRRNEDGGKVLNVSSSSNHARPLFTTALQR